MLRKRETVTMQGFPVGTAEVIVTDGGLVIVSNFKPTTNQKNLALITDMMDFEGRPAAPRESTEGEN